MRAGKGVNNRCLEVEEEKDKMCVSDGVKKKCAKGNSKRRVCWSSKKQCMLDCKSKQRKTMKGRGWEKINCNKETVKYTKDYMKWQVKKNMHKGIDLSRKK